MSDSRINSHGRLPREDGQLFSPAPSEPFRRQDLADVMEYIEGRRPLTANQKLSLQTLINRARGLADGRLRADQDIPLAFSVPNAGFDRDAFEQALRTVIDHNEILRAEFQLDALDHFVICRADAYAADVRVARAADERGAARRMEEEFLRGFPVQCRAERSAGRDNADNRSPLSGALLPRVVRALIVEGPERAHVLIVFHHLVFDGMSCRPFLTALGEAYRACSGAAEPGVAAEPDAHGDCGGAPPGYADFGRWQASLMRDAAFERMAESWGRMLRVEERGGELPLLQLPALREHAPRRPRGPREPPACDPSATFSLPARQGAALRARYGANTEAQLFLGLYAVCLMRVARQDAVVVGMPFDGRPDRFQDSIGYFANPLPILVEGGGGPGEGADRPGDAARRFRGILEQINAQVRAAMDRDDFELGCRHVPFQELVTRYRDRGSPAARKRTALMQALFLPEDFFDWAEVSGSFGMPSGSLQGVHFSDHRFAQLDVQLAVSRERGQESGGKQSERLLFHLASNSLGQRDVEDLAAVLEQLIMSCYGTNSDTICPFRAELVPCAQKRDLLVAFQNQDEAFNTTVCERIGRDETVLDMIAKTVEDHPDNEAVCFRGRRMTYRQLWHASLDVCRRVRARLERLTQKAHSDGGARAAGTAPCRDDVVGMAVERSAEQIVVVLGIMMAGCAYLPFYHNEPVERIQGVIRRHRIGVVVAVDRRFEDYHGDGELRPGDFIRDEDTLLLVPGYEWDKERNFIVPGVGRPDGQVKLPIHLRSDGLCYCLKTSGTTGEPKLVPVQHSAVTNRLFWMQREFPLHTKDRFLRKAPIDFDVSVWEMLWPLVVGACVVVDAACKGLDFCELRRLIKRERVSCLHFVPTLFDAFLGKSKEANTQLESVRGVFCSGEALKWDTVRRCQQQMRNTVCVKNWYGPTEGGEVTSMECLMEASLQHNSVYVPMGKPISNTRIVVLDKNLRLVPIGTLGEVYIVGECLAAGYLDDLEQTRQRFIEVEGLGLARSGTACIPDNEGGGIVRAYRTGDLGSVLADGNVFYHGRMDSQVKLRGVRVELGGIEAMAMGAMLGDGACMEHAACIVHNEQLALFYVVSTTRPRDGHYTELEQFLKRKLPSAQQPHWICQMDEIPVTKTGKLNTARLVERIAQAEAQSDEQDKVLPGDEIGTRGVARLVTPRKATLHERKIRRVLARELRLTEDKLDIDQNVRWMLDSMGMTRISGHLKFVRVVELMDMEVVSMRALVDLFEERQAMAVNKQAYLSVGQKRSQLDSFDSLQSFSTPKKSRSSYYTSHMSTFSPTKLLFTPSTVDMTPSPASLKLSGFCKDGEGRVSASMEYQTPRGHENKNEEYTVIPSVVLNKMVACCREFERIMSEKD